MGGRFSTRQVFAIALAAAAAAMLVPVGVDAASRLVRMAGKGDRVVAVTKKGQLNVAVKNRPSVKVPEGVAVTNKPGVSVPDGVAVTNRPSVSVPDGVAVTNQPSRMEVHAEPGRLNATARPPLDDVFNFHVTDVASLASREVVRFQAPQRVAVTHVAVTVENVPSVDRETIVTVTRWVKTDASDATCGNAGWGEQTTLKRLVVAPMSMDQLDLAAAPLVVVPDPAGRATCVAIKLSQWVGATDVSLSVDGYRF